ncbi:cytosolic protein [Oceanobacillus chungangensis]|uniref:Cytosolic protein n=1 Tax=Oceanobacillus chungangensis TaxID=1229152 RepID=A0A3D8PZJ3_9BACI|nr:cytosolic protein [Oceanobacillus chungangensis]RDW21596.1 cytosolic protein [Oceanobacillus chungangensis]
MSIRNTLSKYFSNHAETREDHWDSSLQTRYYKTTKDKALKKIEELIAKSDSFKVNSISEEHGEIGIIATKGKKVFIVLTVIMVRPFQTAVDFSVTTESIIPMDFGYSTKLINQLYTLVDKELPLITETKAKRSFT